MTRNKKTPGKIEQMKGAVKETLGRAVGNERTTTEGRAHRGKGDLRQRGQKAKGIFKR
ncbi:MULTISPECIES: CsbD family protein [unclassified Streptomyces]|uniref:CsbD family protein n=1 Tax=unclassified Streptomyces TaxID=2593676 RepID=UPI0033B0B891